MGDFGLARELDDDINEPKKGAEKLTKYDVLNPLSLTVRQGTPMWWAPEMASRFYGN